MDLFDLFFGPHYEIIREGVVFALNAATVCWKTGNVCSQGSVSINDPYQWPDPLSPTVWVSVQYLTFRYLTRSADLSSGVVLISWQCWKNLCRCRSWGRDPSASVSLTLTAPHSTLHQCDYVRSKMKNVVVPERISLMLHGSSLWRGSWHFPPTWYLAGTVGRTKKTCLFEQKKKKVNLMLWCCSRWWYCTFLVSWHRYPAGKVAATGSCTSNDCILPSLSKGIQE